MYIVKQEEQGRVYQWYISYRRLYSVYVYSIRIECIWNDKVGGKNLI